MDSFDLPVLETAGVVYGSRSAEEELEAERAAVLAEATERGHADGFEAGRAEALGELQSVIDAARAALSAIEAERDRVVETVETATTELGIRIAEQILGGRIEARPEVVVEIVRGALRRLVDRERVTVLVNPDDLDAMRAAAPELVAELGGVEHCEVQAERRVGRGGAIVRTAEGEIDATIQCKLDRVRELLAGAVDGGDG